MGIQDTFRAKLAGTLRPNRFRAIVTFPSFIANAKDLADACEVLIRTGSLPARELGVIDLPFRGTPFSMAGDFQQPADITLTILNDANMTLRKAAELWIEYIASPVSGTRANDLAYQSLITIQQLDGVDNVVKTYELLNAYPISVGDIALSHDDNDSVETWDLTIRYSTPVTDLL